MSCQGLRRFHHAALVHTLAKTKKVFKAVLIGPPGSHKYDLSERIAKTFQLTHINARDRINLNITKDSKFGRLAKTCTEKGVLVPNKIMIKFITKEILEAEMNDHSWLISGFPVTETQAKLFWAQVRLHMVLYVHFPEDLLVQNLSKRHKGAKGEKFEVTGEHLMEVQQILDNYHKITKPMLNFYKDHGVLHTFYSNNINAMWEKIQRCVDNHVTVFTDEDIH